MPFIAVFHAVTLMVTTRTLGHVPTILKQIYTDLKNPASFSSPMKLFRAAKWVIPQIKFKDVVDWLETQKLYTLHWRVRTKFRRRKVVTRGVRYQYQADLVDYSTLKRDNCRVPCYHAAVGYTLPRLRASQGSNLV